MIVALGYNLWKMKFEDGKFADNIFFDETTFKLVMTEGRQTKKTNYFEKSRTFTYQGRDITSYAHLKKPGNDFRLYFSILEDKRQIIIYHLGEHLPNSQSKGLR
jgi:hypothetical protein